MGLYMCLVLMVSQLISRYNKLDDRTQASQDMLDTLDPVLFGGGEGAYF